MMTYSRKEYFLALLLSGATALHAYVREEYQGQVLHRPRTVAFSAGASVRAGFQNASGKTVITPESDPVAAITAAMNTWNNVAGANVNLSLGTASSVDRAGSDGKNIVTFADTAANRSIVGSAIAVTYFYFLPSQGTITDSDIVFNPDLTFATTPTLDAYDLQSIATHELGHAIGAAHTPFTSATMFPYGAPEDTSPRTLSNDERAFAADAFPADGTRGGIRGSITTPKGAFPASALVLVINRDTGVVAAPYSWGNSYVTGGLPAGDYYVIAFPASPLMAGDDTADPDTPDWQPAFYGGATPKTVSVSSGSYTQADISIPDGPAQFYIDFAYFGGSSLGFGSRVTSGTTVPVMLFGSGLPAEVKPEDITFYGTGATVRPDSIEVTAGLLSFVMDVPSQTGWADTAVVVRSGDLAAVSADVRIGPAQLGFAPSGVVNGASFASGPVAPGEIISIFGDRMGLDGGSLAALDDGGMLPTVLEDTSVEIDGRRIPLMYVSSHQINAEVPFEVAGKSSTRIRVRHSGEESEAILPVAAASPGVFGTWDQPAIVNEDGSVNDYRHRAAKGRPVVIYATGQGVIDPPVATGKIAPVSPLSRSSNVTATIAEKDAHVDFAGMTPEFVGLWQVNVVIPADAPSGLAELVLTVNGSYQSVPVYLFVE
jgi:uncharacterized protein (TIGR03437 family)